MNVAIETTEPITLDAQELLGENGFYAFVIGRHAGRWHGAVIDRRTNAAVLEPLAGSAQRRQCAERLTMLAHDHESRLGGFWTSQQVQFFDTLARLAELRGPQHVARMLRSNVPHCDKAVLVECSLCQSECWKRHYEPPIYPEGVQAVCTVCAAAAPVRTCRTCNCTDDDCSQCIQRTGRPCRWVDKDLCSACDGVA